MAHAQCAGSVFRNARRLRLRSCLRFSHFYFIFYARSHALSRERRSGSRTSRSPPAADLRPKRKEKRTARAVCMGAATSLRMTRTTFFWILDLIFILDFYLRTQYSSTYGRPITYLMGGSLVEVHSSSYFCLSHARTVFSCGAPCCNPAHRGGMGSGG